MSTKSTRKKNSVFLIGVRDKDSLARLNQLPTRKDVLRRFHYHLKETKMVRNASQLTITEVLEVWSKAAIPTTLPRNGIEKLEKVHQKWLLIKKNNRRSCVAQRNREKEFTKQLDQIFDIAHADAMTILKIKEDQDFLQDQREDRIMYIATEDKRLAKKQERATKRKMEEEERRLRHLSSSVNETVATTETESSPSNETEKDDDGSDEYKAPKIGKPSQKAMSGKKSKPFLFTPHVVGALDRNKTSDRQALRLVVPIAAALGHDPSTLPVSRSTIRRMRKKARKQQAESALAEFLPDFPLVVHWDGKLLPKILGPGKVDRLPVLVSGDGMDKLLGVPQLDTGTGMNQANAVYEQLEQWKLLEKIKAMSFDTTSVNTGYLNGTCIILEKKLGRELLWLACRHHVMELILSKVFNLCFGHITSPDIPLFKRFKVVWNNLNHDNYRGLEAKADSELGEDFMKTTLVCLRNRLEGKTQVRDDYLELIELTMAVLGSPPERIHWRAPGAIHQARWMGKLLYVMKIFLFRDQRQIFTVTKREETQIKRLVKFCSLIYSKAWTESPLAAEAPGGDLKLWKDLGKYEAIDSEIGIAAKRVLERHLWYLSDELVGLSIFSDRTTVEEKAKIVEGFSKEPAVRNVRGNSSLLTEKADLGVFASERTAELLSRLNIDGSFLSLPPNLWNSNEKYIEGRKRIKELRVVNDTAERGVKLFEEFNKLLTTDEQEKQFVLQVVERNRKSVPTAATKKFISAVVSNLSQ